MQVLFFCGANVLFGLPDRRKAKSGAPAQLVLRGRAVKLYAAKKDTRKKGYPLKAKLSLGELGSATGFFEAVLLSFLDAGVAGEEAFLF